MILTLGKNFYLRFVIRFFLVYFIVYLQYTYKNESLQYTLACTCLLCIYREKQPRPQSNFLKIGFFLLSLIAKRCAWDKARKKRRPNRYWLQENKLVFLMQIFSLMCRNVNLFSKTAVQYVDWVPAYFCGRYKNNLRL